MSGHRRGAQAHADLASHWYGTTTRPEAERVRVVPDEAFLRMNLAGGGVPERARIAEHARAPDDEQREPERQERQRAWPEPSRERHAGTRAMECAGAGAAERRVPST